MKKLNNNRYYGFLLAFLIAFLLPITGIQAADLSVEESSFQEVSVEDPTEKALVEEPIEEKLAEEVNFIQGITESSIWIRPAPNSSESLGILEKGILITGIDRGAWLEFEYKGATAYIAKGLLANQEHITNPEDMITSNVVEGVTSSFLWVRPEKNSQDSLGIIDKGTSIQGVDQGAWFQFSYRGQEAYIASNFVDYETLEDVIPEDPVEDPIEEPIEDPIQDPIEDPVVEPEPEPEPEPVVRYTSTSIWVRPEKNSSESLGILDSNTKITGVVGGAWFKFDYEGQTAYVASALLEEEPDREIVERYTTSSLYVRPEKNSRQSLGIIDANQKVEGYYDGAWFVFNFEGKQAYIANNFLTETLIDDGLVSGLTKSSIYVRPNPGSSQSLGIIDKGVRVEGSIEGAWFKFEYENRTAYIAAGLVDFSQGLHLDIQGFTKSSVYVRDDVNGNVVKILPAGSLIEGEKVSNGNWVKFSHYGEDLYVATWILNEHYSDSWVNAGSYRYYVKDGIFQKGWASIDGAYYYFDPMMGYMYTGVKSTGTNVHYFGNNGKVQSGRRTIYGTSHNQTINFVAPTNQELSNAALYRPENEFLGQAAANTALTAIGTKYYWYGTDLDGGLYCSGLTWRAYYDNGVTIPGPEYGNLEDAKKHGPQTGPLSRGYGSAGQYGYEMTDAQYNRTHLMTGERIYITSYDQLKVGDLVFADSPYWNLDATHAMIYVGKLGNEHRMIHSSFPGTYVDPFSTVSDGWGYTMRYYIQRPYAK